MDIGHQRHLAATPEELLLDTSEILRSLHVGSRDTHQLASRLDQPQRLVNSGLRIHGIGIGHTLHPDRCPSAQREVAYIDLSAHFIF